jgi:hypothetical protein
LARPWQGAAPGLRADGPLTKGVASNVTWSIINKKIIRRVSMKMKIMLMAVMLALAGLALAQQPPQEQPKPPEQPTQQEPVQAEPVAQVALTVEEAVMCTGVEGRVPQGVPSAPLATSTAAATETKPNETTTTTEPATPAAAAPTGGGGDPFPFVQGVGKLYCFNKISGATTATTVKHVWYFGDTVVHTMELSLAGTPWRTWSNKTIPATWTGTGKVEIQDASGTVLKTVHFVVQ